MSCGLQVVRRYVRRFYVPPRLVFPRGRVVWIMDFGWAPLIKITFFAPFLCFLEGESSSVEMGFGLGALGSNDFLWLVPRLAPWLTT